MQPGPPVGTESVAPWAGTLKVPKSPGSLSGPVCDSVVNGIQFMAKLESFLILSHKAETATAKRHLSYLGTWPDGHLTGLLIRGGTPIPLSVFATPPQGNIMGLGQSKEGGLGRLWN